MNIRWTRTWQIKNSRVIEAIGWSKEITGWWQKKHNVNVETWLDVVGTTNTLRWTLDHTDLTAFDKLWAVVQSDPDYWRWIEQATKNDIFIDGVSVDTLSRKV